jgi:hypothetical protein
MTGEIHAPTTAGPTPEPAPTRRAETAPMAPPGAAAAAGRADAPELPFGIPPERPEILVGAAFAGGLLAAFILKRLGGN